MKEYRLAAWPELAPPFHRTAHRRMLCEMSHRHMTLGQLSEVSGLRRSEVRHFVEALAQRGVLTLREIDDAEDSLFGSLRPVGGWIMRTVRPGASRR